MLQGRFCGRVGWGQRTARIASSKTVFRPLWVRAEHSRYFTESRLGQQEGRGLGQGWAKPRPKPRNCTGCGGHLGCVTQSRVFTPLCLSLLMSETGSFTQRERLRPPPPTTRAGLCLSWTQKPFKEGYRPGKKGAQATVTKFLGASLSSRKFPHACLRLPPGGLRNPWPAH